MVLARIYSPAKNAMQSGKWRSEGWVLEYIPEKPKYVEPFMGYTSSRDMRQQIILNFSTMEEAVEYAERENIDYVIQEKHHRNTMHSSYTDNFLSTRRVPWTH